MLENNDRVFTIKELSQYLRIAESSLYKLVREGKIPGQKIGKTWRFFKPAIDSWLSEKSDNKKENI
jgi:excisionase family DNA binding protein